MNWGQEVSKDVPNHVIMSKIESTWKDGGEGISPRLTQRKKLLHFGLLSFMKNEPWDQLAQQQPHN